MLLCSGDPEGVFVDDLFEDVSDFGARFLAIDSVQVATTSDVRGDIGSPAMMDAVTNMVSSFAQKKNVAVVMIGQFEKTGNFGGSEKMQHLVDVLLRMDIQYVEGDDGRLTKDFQSAEDLDRWEESPRRHQHDVAGGADRGRDQAAFDWSGSGNVQAEAGGR